MRRSLKGLIGLPAVVALLVAGAAILLLAATAGGPGGQIVGVFVAILVVLAALALAFLTWLTRVNSEIDTDRPELRRELDETLAEGDSDAGEDSTADS